MDLGEAEAIPDTHNAAEAAAEAEVMEAALMASEFVPMRRRPEGCW